MQTKVSNIGFVGGCCSEQKSEITLASGTVFLIPTAEVDKYGICVGDSAIVVNGQEGRTVCKVIIRMPGGRHKADFEISKAGGNLTGRLTCGTPPPFAEGGGYQSPFDEPKRFFP